MLLKQLPNMLTLGNLSMGMLSIVAIMNQNAKMAVTCILLGMLFDAFDGRMARILKVQQDLGKELDSLADLVTFGVTPSLLMYVFVFNGYGFWGYLCLLLFPLCGAIRLAKFNTDTHRETKHFVGLPITAAGGLITVYSIFHSLFSVWVSGGVLIMLSIMMVSSFKCPSFKEVKMPKIIVLNLPFILAMVIYYVERKINF